jgi:hypothetical protein
MAAKVKSLAIVISNNIARNIINPKARTTTPISSQILTTIKTNTASSNLKQILIILIQIRY